MTDTQEDPFELPVRPRKRGMPRWVFCLRALFLICMLPVFFVIAAAVLVVEHDIAAPSWIVSSIEERAAEVLNGGTLRFGEISLRISKDLHPTVRLIDTQLYDESGLTITRIPLVEGQISPRGLLFRQEVLMQDIRLSGAQINLRRAADGTLAVDLGQSVAAAGAADRSMDEFLDEADHLFERPALEALETVRIDGLVVNYDDARAGRSWIVDGGQMLLDVRGDQTALRGDVSLLSGRAEVTSVNLSYRSPRGSRAAELGLTIENAEASDVASQSPALTWLRDVDAPISASLRTSLDEDGALGPLSAALEIGHGALRPNAATEPVNFQEAKAYLTYEPIRDHIRFDQISVETEWGSLRAGADAYLRDIQDGLPRSLLAQFRFDDLTLNPAEVYPSPVEVPQARVDLRLRFDPFRIDLGEMVVADEDMRLRADGFVAATEDGWQVSLDADINTLSPEKLLRFWPEGLKPGSRKWVAENVFAARLHDLHAGFRLVPGARPELAANFAFSEAEVRFMRHMPHITGGVGVAAVSDHRFVVSLEEGGVLAPEGGPIALAGTSFVVPDTRIRRGPAEVNLSTDSSVTAVLSVLNQPPFTFMDKANLPVTIADGRVAATGRIGFLLKPGITPDEVTYEIAGDVRAVRSDVLIPDRRMAAARIGVSVDNTGLRVGGPLRVGDVLVDGQWEQRIGPAFKGRSQVTAEVELSPAFLEEFGIALPAGWVTGRGQGQLTIDLVRGAPPAFSLTSDLLGVRVAIPPVGWSKSPATEGALLVEGTLGDVPEVTNLEISGGGLSAQGRVTLNDEKRLEAARFDRFRVGNWLDVPITLRGRGPGQPVAVEIDGGTLDLRRATFGGGGSEGGPMQIRLDRLQVTEGIALTSFGGAFSSAGGFSGQFQARLNGASVVQGTVAPRNGRSAVRLVSDDAGGVLRAAAFMRNAVDGTLDLTLLPAAEAGTFDGFLSIRQLRVRDAPAMAALLDAISVVGLLQQLDGQGLAFDEVDARFRLSPDRVVVTQSSAVGPGLGISLDGVYTLASKKMEFQGVVSPFYLLNGIGAFLTRRGEGLIGFNFNILGTSSAPQVSVNPLSALTPGMFREIFRRPPPDVTQ
ncbi:DUF3971 domain-containing protein [Loktanella agnita]|uniref:DUF3971 domain-containing protein n=1 Tax=Loktanella agnita TaxID=287097 RepID=UPI00398849BA